MEEQYRESLIEQLDLLAKEAHENDESNTAVVLNVLLGALYGKSDPLLADVCQDFARKERERIISSRN
ncbi:hypothetical protein JYT53_01210 [Cytophagaceae bacterium AH-315-L13]|nr:hypothetical protein [Cytophagaceae bacterium AH-315-L13]